MVKVVSGSLDEVQALLKLEHVGISQAVPPGRQIASGQAALHVLHVLPLKTRGVTPLQISMQVDRALY